MTKRRPFFLALTAALLALTFFAQRHAAALTVKEPLEPVTLLLATDLHYLAPELTDHGAFFESLIRRGDGKDMDYCAELTDAFLAQVTERKPDALIISGDLTFNGARLSHEALAKKLRAVEDAGVPVLVLPGNHDIANPSAAAFRGDGYTLVESISTAEFIKLYGAFGHSEAFSTDAASASYVTELKPGLWILMLDVNTADSPGSPKEETLAWLETVLAGAERQGARVVAVSHQNLLAHNTMFTYGFVMENSAAVLALYEKYGVVCNVSGHMHIQNIAKSRGGLTDIAGSALIVSPNQYGVLTLAGTEAEYRTEPVAVQLPGDADFSAHAYKFLWDTGYRQAMSQLPEDLEEADALAGFFADINTAYIGGRMSTAPWDDMLFLKWKDRSVFMASYLNSLTGFGFTDQTEAVFPLDR